VNRHYTDEDTRLGKLPDFFQTMDAEHRAAHLQNHMEALGFDTSLQKFTVFRTNNTITGTNVHGILRAPRGEGTEALVLSAPHYFDNRCIY
jgi:glycosylphosphatidylinositol transamidase